MENGVTAYLEVDILKASATRARLAVPQAERAVCPSAHIIKYACREGGREGREGRGGGGGGREGGRGERMASEDDILGGKCMRRVDCI